MCVAFSCGKRTLHGSPLRRKALRGATHAALNRMTRRNQRLVTRSSASQTTWETKSNILWSLCIYRIRKFIIRRPTEEKHLGPMQLGYWKFLQMWHRPKQQLPRIGRSNNTLWTDIMLLSIGQSNNSRYDDETCMEQIH
jgi:hypothetical protein